MDYLNTEKWVERHRSFDKRTAHTMRIFDFKMTTEMICKTSLNDCLNMGDC